MHTLFVYVKYVCNCKKSNARIISILRQKAPDHVYVLG